MREVELVNAIDKEIIIIDDCSIDGTPDMEYDPYAYNELIKPVLRGNADVVYGSRFRGGNPAVSSSPGIPQGITYRR